MRSISYEPDSGGTDKIINYFPSVPRLQGMGDPPPSSTLSGSFFLFSSKLRGRQQRLRIHSNKSPENPGNGNSQGLGILNQPKSQRLELLKHSQVLQEGDIFLYRCGINSLDLAPERPGLDHLFFDDRLNRLQSLGFQTLTKLAQRGRLEMLSFVCRYLATDHPRKVLMKSCHRSFVRKFEPVPKSHESHQKPCWVQGDFAKERLLGIKRNLSILKYLHNDFFRVNYLIYGSLKTNKH